MVKYYVVFTISMVLCVSFLTGCDSKYLKTEYVEGVITLDGTPVAGANIGFSPVKGSVGAMDAYGVSDADGVYKLQTNEGKVDGGTTEGEYIVIVSKMEYSDSNVFEVGPDGTKRMIPKADNKLPEKYRRVTKSPLKKTVTKGKNKIDIELTSK